MKSFLLPTLLIVFLPQLQGQSTRLYTEAEPNNTGSLAGESSLPLSHAVAVERDRSRVFAADLSQNRTAFSFPHLPVGKYDLLLITEDGCVFEGMFLGGDVLLEEEQKHTLEERILAADTFFNRTKIHRIGKTEEAVLVLVERMRDAETVRHSGAALDELIRRIEVIELEPAGHTFQQIATRHLLRETSPMKKDTPFYSFQYLPELSNHRVVTSKKQLGRIPLAPPPVSE